MVIESTGLFEVPKANRQAGTFVYAIDVTPDQAGRVRYGRLHEYRSPLGLWEIRTREDSVIDWFLQDEDHIFDSFEEAEAALAVCAIAGQLSPDRIFV